MEISDSSLKGNGCLTSSSSSSSSDVTAYGSTDVQLVHGVLLLRDLRVLLGSALLLLRLRKLRLPPCISLEGDEYDETTPAV